MFTDITLTKEQNSAVEMVLDNRISILTGGPGTGKTTTCLEILNCARIDQNWVVSLAAPSGKAAKRMSEATGQSASTIHKMLDAYMDDSGEFCFKQNELNPLEADLVIIDETSMVSTDLMTNLLNAIDTMVTRILFVGDQDQLPSIGPGAILRDFLASKEIPHIELTEIQRNSGEIVRVCHEIKHGNSYTSCNTLNTENGDNYRHLETASPVEIQRRILELVINRFPTKGYDPLWDIQVISPMNTRTNLSCKALNEMLQDALNPNPPINDTIFRIGDKCIQTKNKSIGHDYIVNGDLCKILDITKKEIIAQFFDPDREIKLPLKSNKLLLAYAITCHRFQGSEAPIIIVPVHRTFGIFVTRPWIYTAISRAQEICLTIGQFSAIEAAIDRTDSNKRVTRLQEALH